MPTEGIDIVELAEQRMNELYKRLEKMDLADPNRKSIVDEITDHARIVDDYETRNLKRLDSNAKNDIEETRLVIDSDRNLIEKARVRTERMKLFAYIIGGIGTGIMSYNMDKIKISAKPLAKFKDDLIAKLGR